MRLQKVKLSLKIDLLVSKSSQKGNIYMLSVKNKCHEGMTAIPDMGIGLMNIKSVCEKYNGTMHIELQNEVYHISILFIISQQ